MGRTGAWKVPGYVADELIGRGSTGHVWRGRAVRSGEPVALKRLPGSDPDRLRAARAEAALLSALDHPNLIRLRELVPTPNAVVLVLDLADGGSLASLLDRRGHLTVGEMVSALAPIGAALAFAHDQGVVHGDVSPANVLFSVRGLPLLADLGVARLLGDESSAASTLGYLDPAVAAGSPPGSASDVFMLAATALHCLDGRPPWCADSADELVAMAAIGEIHGLDQRLRAAP
ncbi:MAG: serine/threonine protein kinase, partial [Actinomycetota bacterium]|nr:serine/threonine protein kinase [Actinomycetota bacterium]